MDTGDNEQHLLRLLSNNGECSSCPRCIPASPRHSECSPKEACRGPMVLTYMSKSKQRCARSDQGEMTRLLDNAAATDPHRQCPGTQPQPPPPTRHENTHKGLKQGPMFYTVNKLLIRRCFTQKCAVTVPIARQFQWLVRDSKVIPVLLVRHGKVILILSTQHPHAASQTVWPWGVRAFVKLATGSFLSVTHLYVHG